MHSKPALLLGALILAIGTFSGASAQLHIGGATVDITPDQPVALDGQRNLRISKKPQTPITASVLALESRDGDKPLDEAIIVSCDLVAIRQGVLQQVRDKVKSRLPGFDVQKLFMSATHTHTAPVTVDGRYTLPETGVMKPGDYAEWMTTQIADGIADAWKKRQPGKVAWGQGQAVVAQNRRAIYANGTSAMYGKTDSPDFRAIEGYEDHNVEVLFFWDMQDELIATSINIACPSQEVGGGTSINADFWHPVRNKLREQHGKDLTILAWAGAAGDLTSRLMYGTAADARMRKLHGNVSRMDEIARRIVNAWDDALDGAKHDIRTDVPLLHRVKTLQLPRRQVTEMELAEAKREAAKYEKDPKQRWNYLWNQGVVTRHELQKGGLEGPFEMELHALRLGDVAIASNEFELFTDYGVQMKARSPAIQTFVIQLSGPGTYLPSVRAAKGGGYSAVIQSNVVGPEGGQMLVNRTLEVLNEFWPKR